jgi:hypothetical protein
LGIGDIELREADLVESKIQEIGLQMVYIVQTCNKEKEVIKKEFIWVREQLKTIAEEIRM